MEKPGTVIVPGFLFLAIMGAVFLLIPIYFIWRR